MSDITQSNQKKTDNIPQVNLLQIFGYTFLILGIWVIPLAISVFLFIIFYNFFIHSDLHIYSDPIEVFRKLFNNQPQYFLVSVITPLIGIFLYLLFLFHVALFTKISIYFCNHKSPMREMIGAKGIEPVEKLDVDIYHLRGAIYRIMKWIFARAPFPWIMKWAFTFVSNNKYGKGTILEDQFYCHEYLETGKNVYIDKMAIVSSHLVDGRYGALTLKKVKIGDNAVINAKVGICPGVYMEPNSAVLFNSFIPKFKRLKSNEIYHGIPVVKLQDSSVDEMLNNGKNHSKTIKKEENSNV